MANFLQIMNETVTNNLNVHTENEYYMSEEQIVELLTSGSLEAFLDCLDFAPVGVIDLIKKYAISLPLNDITKRDALKEKTGFDVSTAIANAALDKNDEDASTTTTTTTARRTTTNYKVVNSATE
jgi:hypothetical protein